MSNRVEILASQIKIYHKEIVNDYDDEPEEKKEPDENAVKLKDVDLRKDINFQKIGVFTTIPFVLAVPVLIGWWVGKWLDKYLDSSPYLMYLLILLGALSGIREFIRIINRYGKDD